ncbi:response regulator [Bradymonas sediminis]|uniref:histidine kinase n=1 Tax=Bradymonas sediminis TaxID=1548548 RepID=A0A2Z4FIP2_9DELT|nr:response regulator [Bradymonas sediminis]AWV88812.1 hybrid sensor histidine kinase/response regulator [Bradymonas sediminis]TDP71811.1 PAS domain S-box-containing protein [Bradymonas sediminis]
MSNSPDEPLKTELLPGNGRDIPFATIVETINDGILLLRLDSTITYVNASMAAMIGFESEQMVGRSIFDFMSEHWANVARENLKRRGDGVAEMFDHCWEHKNGEEVWTLVSAKPMHDDAGVRWGSLVAIQDISERKDAERKLSAARDELEERVQERTLQLSEAVERLNEEVAERRAAEEQALEASRAKSAFLANMSHELRTPLNAVIGYSELIGEDLDLGINDLGSLPLESIRSDINKVHKAAKHLLVLINDILDLSKVEAGKMDLHLEPFDLAGLVEEVVDTMSPLVTENNNQIACTGEMGIELVADRTKLKQILLNLTGNAVKFTENGEITLHFVEESVGGRDGVRIDVVDTGMGIPDDEIDLMFEPFTQVDDSTTRRHGGTGLGLAICKRFCEMMGGFVHVESEVGVGTTVSVHLPSAAMRAGDEESVAFWSEEVAQHALSSHNNNEIGPMVLIIDDDPNVHELMRRFLKPRGFRLFSAFDGERGIELARELRPDVITLDVMMPGRDGWSVLSELKSDASLDEIPVVMVTMLDDKSIGYALGAADYLVKPIERERLVRVLSRFDRSRGGVALVVEDETEIREVIKRHLERAGWTVQTAANGRLALDALEVDCPDVVLLDLMMPEMDGFEVAEIMRMEPRWQKIPIVVVTAMDLDEADRSQLNRSVERIMDKNISSIEMVISEVLNIAGTALTKAPGVT